MRWNPVPLGNFLGIARHLQARPPVKPHSDHHDGGLDFAGLIGGAIITERIFSWPGIGNWILDGVHVRDQDVIQAGVLAIACGFTLLNLVVDLLYVAVDPRLSHR